MAQPDTATMGLYIYSLYDLNLADKSFGTVFYLWVNHHNDSLSFDGNLEVVNAKSTEYSLYFDVDLEDDARWVSQKCRAQVIKDWDISNYPFDKQVLTIQLEEGNEDASLLILKADTINSKIHREIKLRDWQITGFKISDGITVYETTYGDPNLKGESRYAMIRADIFLERINVWVIFFKIFTGVFVGFLISVFVFFIKPINVDPRFGLCVGGLFAAVGNKYVVESTVATVSSNTLIDTLHNLTFVAILLVIAISVLSLYIYEKGGEKNLQISKRIDVWSFILILVFYIIFAAVAVQRAMHGA